MTTASLKDALEILYYIAFICLTVLIVHYTRRTYELEAEKKYELLCNLIILENASGSSVLDYALEVYNSGNKAAKNVEVQIQNKYITTFNIVKPNSASVFPIGLILRTLSGNEPSPTNSILPKQNEKLAVKLIVDGKTTDYELNTDILFVSRGNITSTLKGIESKLDNIEKAIRKH